MIIGIDFDGTCVTHEYPNVGKDIGAVPILKKLVNQGHKLILFTMRHGETLKAAENWFLENGIELFGVNVNPEQHTWTSSPKAYCHLYIDDAGLNIPLINNGGRPYVNWTHVKNLLIFKGVIKNV